MEAKAKKRVPFILIRMGRRYFRWVFKKEMKASDIFCLHKEHSSTTRDLCIQLVVALKFLFSSRRSSATVELLL